MKTFKELEYSAEFFLLEEFASKESNKLYNENAPKYKSLSPSGNVINANYESIEIPEDALVIECDNVHVYLIHEYEARLRYINEEVELTNKDYLIETIKNLSYK